MKYFYLFILITTTIALAGKGITGRSELNKEQGKQIESLIIKDQNGEKGVENKANGLMANTPYYIGKLYDETTPMVVSNQFVKPVLKFGIPGKEPEYTYHNESLRLRLLTLENRKAVILNRSIWITNNWQTDEKKKELYIKVLKY